MFEIVKTDVKTKIPRFFEIDCKLEMFLPATDVRGSSVIQLKKTKYKGLNRKRERLRCT